MAKSQATTNLHWSPWIWNVGKNWKSNLSDGYQFGDILGGWFGFDRHYDDGSASIEQASNILGEAQANSRQEFLEDREHTEGREDTTYQRSVEDMRKAGLNPYTIGANPAPASASTVGENSIMTSLQVVGSILDIQNLSVKNKGLINNIIGNILKSYARK